ncbi:MAG TPA: RNA methyltransferase [Chloroflexota bacterium]
MITSRSNPSVKRIRELRHRKHREESGLFVVEGIRLVGEAAEMRAEVETVVVAPDLLQSQYAHVSTERLRSRGAELLEVSADVFRSLSSRDGPQGIAAVLPQRWDTLDNIEPGSELCWVALEAVQDPGNLGSILRTADAVGAGGVFLLGPTTDPFDPAAVRASMGAILSQRVVRASVAELAAWKERHDAFVVGTSDSGSVEYTTIAYRSPTVLLMGSEREGLHPDQRAVSDLVARIPMVGHSDSLNLSVATGVMLYEIFNQRRLSGG